MFFPVKEMVRSTHVFLQEERYVEVASSEKTFLLILVY